VSQPNGPKKRYNNRKTFVTIQVQQECHSEGIFFDFEHIAGAKKDPVRRNDMRAEGFQATCLAGGIFFSTGTVLNLKKILPG
jgi:hypothetical protein